jgi:hypothetical protein
VSSVIPEKKQKAAPQTRAMDDGAVVMRCCRQHCIQHPQLERASLLTPSPFHPFPVLTSGTFLFPLLLGPDTAYSARPIPRSLSYCPSTYACALLTPPRLSIVLTYPNVCSGLHAGIHPSSTTASSPASAHHKAYLQQFGSHRALRA